MLQWRWRLGCTGLHWTGMVWVGLRWAGLVDGWSVPFFTSFGTISYFLNKPNEGSLSLSDEMNVDFAEMVRI